MQGIPWDDVRLFLALCRARNLGGAAKALGVDASTVSRRLAALEEALAVRLFDRSREGITPTEAAEGLLPVAEELEVGMARFTSAADALEREVAGLVRLTCPPDLAELLVAPLVRELLGRHPALRIALEPGEAVRDLSRREADVALRTVRPVRGDLVVTRLTAVPWVLVAAPSLVKQLGVLKRWEDAPWVGWGERLAHLAPARWLAAHARGVEPRVQSESLRVQLAAVAAGVGVALVPEPSVAHFGLAPVRLAAPLKAAAAQLPVDELFLVTHRALREVPRVRVLWELLRERLGDGAR